MSILDQVEKEALDIIEQKCHEYRMRTNTLADELLPDCSLFLE
jgi:hypothetical protein